MATLYEISGEYEQMQAWLEDLEGDVTGVEAQLDAWLEGLGEARDEKLDGYAALIHELNARAAARAAEAARLTKLVRQDEANAKRLKSRVHEFFKRHGLTKIETERFKLTLAKNGGKQPIVIGDEVDPFALPPSLTKVEVTPDRDAIREALENGQEVKGCELGERGTNLRIR